MVRLSKPPIGLTRAVASEKLPGQLELNLLLHVFTAGVLSERHGDPEKPVEDDCHLFWATPRHCRRSDIKVGPDMYSSSGDLGLTQETYRYELEQKN